MDTCQCRAGGRKASFADCRALDRSGEAIYAGPASRRGVFAAVKIHPHPDAAVRTMSAKALIRRPGRRGAAAALLLLLVLPGCHLIDQTDFDRRVSAPPPPPPIPDPETRPALMTIDYTRPDPDYGATLKTTVNAVETRRPGSLYDVVAVVADGSGAPVGRNRAAEVMTAIEAAGVNPARIQLGLKLEPGRKIPQVRVYLR